MTGTAYDLCEYDETETRCLNKFDVFSLWLFEKIKNDRLQVECSLVRESILIGNEPMKSDVAFNDGGSEGL